jgi:DNA-binding NarL/FixJ family response regulator
MTEDRIKGYKIGCKAYLAKPFDPEELVAIIDNVLLDKKNIRNIVNIKNEIQSLRTQIYNFGHYNRNLNFTTREINILLAVSRGLSNKEIAHNFNISVRNVENYITRLLDKTCVSNRVKLANYKHLVQKGE